MPSSRQARHNHGLVMMSDTPSFNPPLRTLPRGKFAPPHWAFEVIVPQALAKWQSPAALPRLLSVCAPAGYGKSVFLSTLWAAAAGHGRRLWVGLDDRDDSLAALLALIAGALAVDTSAEPASTAKPPGDWPAAQALPQAEWLLERLTEVPTLLFIDNLHCCRDPALGAWLTRLLFEHEAPLRLVLSCANALPLDMTRARLALGAVEIGAAQLRFSLDDTLRLFAPAPDASHTPTTPLAEATLHRLHGQTEGWPAGLRLLQSLLADGWTEDDVRQRLRGDDPDIAALLTSRVLAGVDPEVERFFESIALLREFNAELAAHMTEEPRAAEWIDALVSRHQLVFAIDRARHWLRMHTLLREYLQARARQTLAPARRQRLLERAAQWHADQGDLPTAIDLALQAPSLVLASQWVDAVADATVAGQGQLTLLAGWVDRLVAAGATVSLNTQVWQVWALCFSLQYERAACALEDLDARLRALGPDPVAEPQLRWRLGMLRSVVYVQLDAMDAAEREIVPRLHDPAPGDALALTAVAGGAALVALAKGQLTGVRAYLERAHGAALRSHSPYGLAWETAVHACVCLAEAQPDRAQQLLTSAREALVASLGSAVHAVGVIDAVLARALLEQGHHDEAAAAAITSLGKVQQHGVVDTVAPVLATCLALDERQPNAAFAPERLDAVVNAYPPRLHRLLGAMRVRRCVRQGQHDAALALAREHRLLVADAAGDQPLGHGDLLLAKLDVMAMGGASKGLARTLNRELKRALEHGRRRDLIDLHLLAGGHALRSGDTPLALRHLHMALLQAAPGRLLHPFLQQLPVWRTVLQTLRDKDLGLTQVNELALLDQLRAACQGLAQPDPRADPSALLGSLTPRELQFLSWIDQGLSNQQIADRALLALDTVKWHLKNLYGKLGVGSRSGALAKARSLRILAG